MILSPSGIASLNNDFTQLSPKSEEGTKILSPTIEVTMSPSISPDRAPAVFFFLFFSPAFFLRKNFKTSGTIQIGFVPFPFFDSFSRFFRRGKKCLGPHTHNIARISSIFNRFIVLLLGQNRPYKLGKNYFVNGHVFKNWIIFAIFRAPIARYPASIET